MKSASINKILSLFLSFSLLIPNIAMAGQASSPKTQAEIKQALTSPEKYSKTSAAEYIAWSIGVLAAGAIGYKAGHFIGDIKGFGRGFNAAGGFSAKELTHSQAVIIARLEKQVAALQTQLLSAKSAGSAEDKVIRLIVRLNSQLASLKDKQTGRTEAETIKKSIRKTIEDISVAEVKDPGTKRILSKFLTQAEKSLGKKTAITALASLFVSIAIAALMLGEEGQQEISSSRIIVSRQLAQAFEAGPQVFTLKALYLKQKYGLEVVSSVIYENQAKYYPALQGQLALFENKENRLLADFITQDMASAPASHKTALLDNIKTAAPLSYQAAL